MIDALYSLTLLMFIAVLLVSLAQRLSIPYPILLVFGGGAISFIPGLPTLHLEPNVVIFSVLPPILYYAALNLSLREFKKNFLSIMSLAFILVLITTLVVGSVFKWLFPELPYALAFAFGAIISPPDAVAVVSILRRFAISPRILATLEGESLINDASALVLNKIAVVALLSGSFSVHEATFDFFQITVGGVLIGIIGSSIFHYIFNRLKEPSLVAVCSFTLPYLLYMSSELLHFSGVLAVVTSGLIYNRLLPKYSSPQTRIITGSTWSVFIVLLNCLVFIIIGSQLHDISGVMSIETQLTYVLYGAVFTFVLLLVRLSWIFVYRGVIPFIRGNFSLDKLKSAFIVGWSGMRGIVSLVAALALPNVLSTGDPTPGRDEVIFLTYVVIAFSLLLPSLTLPIIVRWLQPQQLPNPCTLKEARLRLQHAAQQVLENLYNSTPLTLEDKNFLANYFAVRHRIVGLNFESGVNYQTIERARKKIVKAQWDMLIKLWEQQEVDDHILRIIAQELDSEEFHSLSSKLR